VTRGMGGEKGRGGGIWANSWATTQNWLVVFPFPHRQKKGRGGEGETMREGGKGHLSFRTRLVVLNALGGEFWKSVEEPHR